MSKTAAVIPSTGIGDALLMMVASHNLYKKGYEVTTYHPKLHELKEWFVGHTFESTFTTEELENYDLVILQNNDSEKAASLIENRGKNLSIFYPTYKQGKHPPLASSDKAFDGKRTMVGNIAHSTASLLGLNDFSEDNGLIVLPQITHRLYKNRIVIQPISTDPKRTWLRSRFVRLAKALKKKGFHPIFTLTPEQKEDPIWEDTGIEALHFETLSDLSTFVYESGYVIGNDSLLPHLASNLNIPHLVIGHLEDHMRLWQPGWLKGKMLLPPAWAPNIKFLRLRDSHWKQWITARQALRAFDDLTRTP